MAKKYEIIEGYLVPVTSQEKAVQYKQVSDFLHTPMVKLMVETTIQIMRDGLRVLGTFRGPDDLYHVITFVNEDPNIGYELFLSRFLTFEKAIEYGFIDRELPRQCVVEN